MGAKSSDKLQIHESYDKIRENQIRIVLFVYGNTEFSSIDKEHYSSLCDLIVNGTVMGFQCNLTSKANNLCVYKLERFKCMQMCN